MWQQSANINIISKKKEEYSLSDRLKNSANIALFIFGKYIDKNDKEKRPLYQTQVEKELISLTSNSKQKLLLYYFVYKTMLHYNNSDEFKNDFDNLRDIVDCRNAYTHEGGQLTDQQRDTFSKVMSNPVKYYFTFIGTYCKLIQGLCSYESTIQEIRDFLNNLKEEKNGVVCDASIKSILPSACFIAIGNNYLKIEGKLYNKCKKLNEGDSIKTFPTAETI